MRLLFDTGSSWLWMASVDCPDSQCIKGHYNYKKSMTLKVLKKREKIVYGIGGVSGTVCNDVVKVGEHHNSTTQTKLTKINFLLVDQANNLEQLYSDGLVGLSPKKPLEKNSKDGVELLIRQMKKSGAIEKAIISLYIQSE